MAGLLAVVGNILQKTGETTMSMERPDPPLKLYWVTMKMEASYSILVPAISEVEAIILADEKPLPLMELEDVEKDVVQVEETEAM